MSVELSGFFLPGQAAKILGVSRLTVHRWLKDGKLQFVLVAGQRMITISELERVKKEKAEAILQKEVYLRESLNS